MSANWIIFFPLFVFSSLTDGTHVLTHTRTLSIAYNWLHHGYICAECRGILPSQLATGHSSSCPSALMDNVVYMRASWSIACSWMEKRTSSSHAMRMHQYTLLEFKRTGSISIVAAAVADAALGIEYQLSPVLSISRPFRIKIHLWLAQVTPSVRNAVRTILANFVCLSRVAYECLLCCPHVRVMIHLKRCLQRIPFFNLTEQVYYLFISLSLPLLNN